MQSQTNGIRNLIMKEYFHLKIPIPPPEKQTEIANHISALRTQAKQLQQQAAAELEQAKQQVEQLILGVSD
jgi:restriction endonuclease S subunit